MEYPVIERLNPNSRFPYVCESERESEDKTVFYLKSLSILEYRRCEESIGTNKAKYGAFGLMALKHGLIGWDNLIDDDGKIIPFDSSNLDTIPYMSSAIRWSSCSANASYLASPEGILQVLASQDNAFNDVLVCGHNPGLTVLLNQLTGAGINDVPTCGFAIIEAPILEWTELARGRLVTFDFPDNYREAQPGS